MKNTCIDIEKIKFNSFRIGLALLSGVSKHNAEQGQVIIMDMHNGSIVGHVSLKTHQGEGGVVYRAQRVKESNGFEMVLEETAQYLVTNDFYSMPLSIIMPVISYLLLLELGAHPNNLVTWTGGKTSVQDLFLLGHHQTLVEAAERFIPKGFNTLRAVANVLGFLPIDSPPNLDQLQRTRLYPFQMLEWLNLLAQGKGLSKIFKATTDNQNEPRKSIKMLQELLRRCGNEAMAKTSTELKTPISGYSFVSMPNGNYSRDITFCGSFPADNPKYGIITWLYQKEEESETLNSEERIELGELAIDVTKIVVDYIMSTIQ